MLALDAPYQLRSPTLLRIAEAPRDPLNEAELSRIWAAQSFPPGAITLLNGSLLRIILPGRPGGGAGPDFRDAIVAIDGDERHGDIELHVRASSFYSHGHHRDSAYNNVVLHVVYAADDGPVTNLQDGSQTPVAAFEPWVGRRSEELQHWLAAPPFWQEPCSDASIRLGKEGLMHTLQAQGTQRIEARIARLRDAVAAAGEEQALWTALLDSLGHGPDRAAWRRLAEILPPSSLRDLAAVHGPHAVEAALLSVAGLAQAPEDFAAALPRALSPALQGGSMPANRPQRRLRALANLWLRAEGDLPAFSRASILEYPRPRDLARRWSVADPLGGAALLGEQRAREILLNAVLPFAALDPSTRDAALRHLQALPAAPAYGKTAFLEANLRRSADSLRVASALQQQGLLAMVADWCRQGGCGRCPLS